jgi:signal transduction histidine kinase
VKSRWKIGGGSGQLRPVLVLLAIAVILPTVCLLWFMNRAVENVRMAARQMLIDEYRQDVKELEKSTDEIWANRAKFVERSVHLPAIHHFATITLSQAGLNGGLMYNTSGKLEYPILDSAGFAESQLPKEFEQAWQLEFIERNFVKATEVYEKIAQSTEDDYLWRRATLGMVRCYRTMGNTDKARKYCHDVGYDRIGPQISAASVSLAARARIMLAELDRGALTRSEPLPSTEVLALATATMSYNPDAGPAFLPMDSGTRIFVLERAVKMAEEKPPEQPYLLLIQPELERAKKLLVAERLAAEVAQRYADTTSFRHWKVGGVHRLDVASDIYGLYYKAADKTFLLLRSGEDVRKDFSAFEKGFAGSDILYRVVDDKGVYVSGIKETGERAFLTPPVGKSLPGWRVELYFRDSDVFEKKAGREVALYTWTGVLVILLILLAGGFAGQAIGKQIKLNRLKNDFIATVSHELKTPLASMRVLVDTLLEGRYKDQQQVTDYLRLVSRENERLTGLIDNFLTFSRMERHKQAFAFETVSPAAIARHAADAVKTKFGNGKCEFDISIAQDLPDILADRDAMVTVLVNLLDNAYKYSHDEKRIELSVFSEDGSVCFCVSDNGVGLSRRVAKKIFDRFYQADRSLTRPAEGCGLGLSIVKFIVDAHKGTISVDSKPGKGSTFTVRLPTSRQAGNGKD